MSGRSFNYEYCRVSDMIPSTQSTTPLDLVPYTSGTAITADRYVPLTTNVVGDWIEYLHPLPSEVNEVYDRIREIELRHQRMEPILFDDSQFDGDRREWLQEILEPFEVEEIQPFTDYADEQWQIPLLSSTPIIPFTDDELEQLLQER